MRGLPEGMGVWDEGEPSDHQTEQNRPGTDERPDRVPHWHYHTQSATFTAAHIYVSTRTSYVHVYMHILGLSPFPLYAYY